MPELSALLAKRAALVAQHAGLLDQAREAIHTRGYFSAYAESPSTRVWGEAAPAEGLAAF